MMKLRLAALSTVVCFPCMTYGDQKVDLNSPEGWAMAFMTTSTQNLGQTPPQASSFKEIAISAELNSIPHLTREQQKIGFGGFKAEDLNKSPAFGRLRATIGLPWNLSAEMSWTPPVQINGSRPKSLWGAAVSSPLISSEKFAVGMRVFLLRGGVTASVTCSSDTTRFEPYTPENIVGCVGESNDNLKMDHEGVEVFLSLNNPSELRPWVSLSSSYLDMSVAIEAQLKAGSERAFISSSGSVQTISVGLIYDINSSSSLTLASSYTPLEAQRLSKLRSRDDFWNFRAGFLFRF
ncbi:MAG: hypothetical protein P8P26_04680 [Porticoccaceae bacterium]|nr:hypothetical protein [Porticoccaceae bacterium]MDG1311337.1 hypothetical protein [Porticoccaceae bacterium]